MVPKKIKSTQVEITQPMKLLDSDGSLFRPGWARNNIIEYNREAITAPKWRIKEWDFYQVGCKDWMCQLNFFNISIASCALVTFVNLNTGEKVSDMILDIGTINRFQVNRNGERPYIFERKKGKKCLRFEVTEKERHLYWKSPKIEVDFVGENYTGENIVVMTPFKQKSNRFFFTEKINCMPTKGYVKYGGLFKKKIVDGNRHDLYMVLDWGRGPWMHKNYWFWGNGTTRIDDKLLGFEITWGIGDERHATETAIIYDGKCHKLGEVSIEREPDDHWDEPWVFHEENGRFELTMTPTYVHKDGLMTPLVGMLTHQVHGLWNGTVTLDDGTVIEIKDMYAFCEKVYNRW